jgi:hypothetical protein
MDGSVMLSEVSKVLSYVEDRANIIIYTNTIMITYTYIEREHVCNSGIVYGDWWERERKRE